MPPSASNPDIPLSLLRDIQLAALDPSRWQLVLDQMSRACDGIRTQLFGYDVVFKNNAVAAASGYDPWAIQVFEEYYGSVNPWAAGWASARVGEVVPAQKMVADDVLRRSEFYSDWIVPQEDIALGGGVILERDKRRMFVIGANIRRKDGIGRQEAWLAMVGLLTPFLRSSLEISRMLRGLRLDNYLLQRGIDPGGAAIVVVDASERIMFTNDRAEGLFDRDEFIRYDERGRLRFGSQAAAENFARIRQQGVLASDSRVAVHGANEMAIEMRAMALDDHALEIFPFWVCGFLTLPMTILILREQIENDPVDLVGAQLGLTAAQSAVCQMIAAGRTPNEIAEERGTSIVTVRNQIKAAMERTETRRQVDLVLLVERALRGL